MVKIKHSKLARHLATRREPSGRERTVRTQSLCGRRHVAVILDDAPAIDAWSRFGHQDRQTCIQHLLGDKATTIPVPAMTTSAPVSLAMRIHLSMPGLQSLNQGCNQSHIRVMTGSHCNRLAGADWTKHGDEPSLSNRVANLGHHRPAFDQH